MRLKEWQRTDFVGVWKMKREKVSESERLMDLWDYELNTGISPEEVTCGARRMAHWKCSEGHRWESFVYAVDSGSGCPYCAGKRVIRGLNDLESRCPEIVDELWDWEKNEILPSEITWSNSKKVYWKCRKGHTWMATVNNITQGKGCPYCAGNKVWKGFNDFESKYPEKSVLWDYERNDIKPSDVTYGSGRKVFWKCQEGHSWKASVYSVAAGFSCPYCSGLKVVSGENDLYKRFPEIVEEFWDWERNDIDPSAIKAFTNKKYWWRCGNGHNWEATPNGVVLGRRCPYCRGRVKVRYYFIMGNV